MMSTRAFSTEVATEHAFPKNEVGTTWTASAVELLLSPVVNARNAHGGQLGCDNVKRQIRVLFVTAEAHLASAFAYLVVIIHKGHNLVPVPAMLPHVIQNPILEHREVVLWVSQAAN